MLHTMIRSSFSLNLWTFVLACLHAACSLDYSDLEAMGIACPPMDTCVGNRRESSFYHRNCECDSDCTNYQDCCIDVESQPSTLSQASSRNNRNGTICLPFGNPYLHKGVYAVNTCQENWNGPEKVRQKCEGLDDFRDPLKTSPVVDTQSKIAYKNVYCSECNNVLAVRLISFRVALNCKTVPRNVTESDILSNLEYNASLSKWGVNGWNLNLNVKEFYDCDLIYMAADCLENNMRLCRPNAVSTCPSTWRRKSMKRSCESYQAIVEDFNGNLFKNIHCALCNGLMPHEFDCFKPNWRRRRPMPFTIHIDVNQSKKYWDEVTRLNTPDCISDQKYDPFLKKCRSYVRTVPKNERGTSRCAQS